ncbi:MAG: GtrA family protein [Xanthomonadales bacterium]|nr:GtrA family protein [Xanthomonadales bacterium]
MFVKEYFRIELLKFTFSGGVATASHWLVMALLIHAGVAALIATAAGAFFGAVVNYFLQRNVTFQSKTPHRLVLLPYFIVCLQIWIANVLFFYILHYAAEIDATYSQGITTSIVALISYLLYKRIVFNECKS